MKNLVRVKLICEADVISAKATVRLIARFFKLLETITGMQGLGMGVAPQWQILTHATRTMHDGAVDSAWQDDPLTADERSRSEDGGSQSQSQTQSRYGYSADLSEAQLARERRERGRLIPPRSTALAAHIDRTASPEPRGWAQAEGGDDPRRPLPTTLSPIDRGRYPELTRPALSPSRVASTPPSHLRANKPRYGSSPGKSEDDKERCPSAVAHRHAP